MSVVELYYCPKKLFDLAERIDRIYRFENHINEGLINQLVSACRRLHPKVLKRVPYIQQILAHANKHTPENRYPECLRWPDDLMEQLLSKFIEEDALQLYQLVFRFPEWNYSKSTHENINAHIDKIALTWDGLESSQRARLCVVKQQLLKTPRRESKDQSREYEVWSESVRQAILDAYLSRAE